MIPHPILNSRRDDVSAIELRSIQHIDCTIHHFTSDAVEDEDCRTLLPHDALAGKTPCRAQSSSPSPCNLGETKAYMDAMISLRTAPSETKACVHTFVSLRSHPHSRPQDETPAFMDVPDRFGLGTQRIGPIRMNRYSDGVGSVGLNRFRRNRSRIEAHRRLNRSPSHASTHRLVRRIGQDGSTTR